MANPLPEIEASTRRRLVAHRYWAARGKARKYYRPRYRWPSGIRTIYWAKRLYNRLLRTPGLDNLAARSVNAARNMTDRSQ